MYCSVYTVAWSCSCSSVHQFLIQRQKTRRMLRALFTGDMHTACHLIPVPLSYSLHVSPVLLSWGRPHVATTIIVSTSFYSLHEVGPTNMHHVAGWKGEIQRVMLAVGRPTQRPKIGCTPARWMRRLVRPIPPLHKTSLSAVGNVAFVLRPAWAVEGRVVFDTLIRVSGACQHVSLSSSWHTASVHSTSLLVHALRWNLFINTALYNNIAQYIF
jgi:hypothetical protein